MKKVLVIAAHPDDEVLGVGGTIIKLVEKDYEIYTYILTDGSSTQYYGDTKKLNQKKEETFKANDILGVKEVIFGNLPDMKLDTISHVKINNEIEKITNKIEPEIIFTHHSGDVNKDHKLIFESTLVVCRPLPGNNIKKIYSYEVPSSTEWGDNKTKDYFIPNIYVTLNKKQINKKCLAMEKYKTELRDYPHPRSLKSIINCSQHRGNQVGYDYAESFILIRELS
ncbi:PIG-L family deacetylase [Iocasia frigidifontis]|uniref:PIG-L family deacetylase n=1 Tax=Iocasia fonsfrigidae TaxID=2682810 RepID=A0A8A7KNV8_9FIRM|nr:PIG-L family deacetylase [Iocasia fonsfrigidae]QTL99734.1 PIG-L family deacetylase [Iocasia fonsfrigidae]